MSCSSTRTPHHLFVLGSFVQAHCWQVARLPGADESQAARVYLRECAGKGLAVALGAHRLGVPVDVWMAVGHDPAGDEALQLLRREGLSSALVYRLGSTSGHGCGLVDAQGQSSVTVFAGANQLLGPREWVAARQVLERAAVVYAQCEVPLTWVVQALELARCRGALAVLNPSPLPGVNESGLLAHALTCADVLILNRREAQAVLAPVVGAIDDGWTALPASQREACWGQWPRCEWLVITLAEQGCVAYGRGGQVLRVQGFPVADSHPIGAGDAFSAALCAALVQGMGMADALAWANAGGACAAGRPGILGSLPLRSELLHALAGSVPSHAVV